MSVFFGRGARNGTLPPIDKSEFLESSNRPRGSAVCNTVLCLTIYRTFMFKENDYFPMVDVCRCNCSFS